MICFLTLCAPDVLNPPPSWHPSAAPSLTRHSRNPGRHGCNAKGQDGVENNDKWSKSVTLNWEKRTKKGHEGRGGWLPQSQGPSPSRPLHHLQSRWLTVLLLLSTSSVSLRTTHWKRENLIYMYICKSILCRFRFSSTSHSLKQSKNKHCVRTQRMFQTLLSL